jgi:antitoxin component of MazEF toxin-antitoxin module
MGSRVKIQKIQRATNKTYYVNFPGAIADAIDLEKGEEMEWYVEGRNCFVLRRVKPAGSFIAAAKQADAKKPAPRNRRKAKPRAGG